MKPPGFVAALALAAPLLAAAAAPPPEAVQSLLQWLQQSEDNEGAPFAIIDKRDARLWLFDAQRRPVAATPVLLGQAHGDISVPGIGERDMSQILPHERITPAGRFVAEPGRNASGEEIFWIDYDAAVSLHRLRPSDPAERRPQRLLSATPADNRISYGCINVPVVFFVRQLMPLFASGRGVVYLLPEILPAGLLFTPSQRPLEGAAASD
ncbi:MAG: L,D-transpeptidase [Roseateles sp.]|uniref:L,D-transpeptidase n=1 Tax=Roseateles sp. TaxID=1971397 RepID=UPI004036BD7E